MYNVPLAQEDPMSGGQVFSPEEVAKTIPGGEPPPGAETDITTSDIPSSVVSSGAESLYIDKMGDNVVVVKFLEPGQQPPENPENPGFPRGPFSQDAVQAEIEKVKNETQAPAELPPPENPIDGVPSADGNVGPQSFEPTHQGTPPAKEMAGCEGAGSMGEMENPAGYGPDIPINSFRDQKNPLDVLDADFSCRNGCDVQSSTQTIELNADGAQWTCPKCGEVHGVYIKGGRAILPNETEEENLTNIPPTKEMTGCEGEGCISCEGYVNEVDIALGLKAGAVNIAKTVVETKKIDALSVGGILKSTNEKSTKGAHKMDEPGKARTAYKQMEPAVESTIFKSLGNKK